MQQLTDNPPKEPVASSGLYLPNRVIHLLQQSDEETNSKERFRLAQLALDLSRPFRKQTGFSPWAATVFASCCVVTLGLAVAKHWPKTYFYSYPDDYLRIVQRLNDRDFMVQRVEAGLAQETTMMRFCTDYLPWFESGHILQWIRYNDHGSCQSIGPEDRGFDILRDASGLPVLPPNCRFDQVNNHIVCDGKPRFD